MRNTAFTTRTTKAPAMCQHCNKPVSSPPAWIRVLAAMAPGAGKPEPAWSITAIADKLGNSRQRVSQMVADGLKAGVLEVPADIRGAGVYRRKWYGRQLLGRWKSAGWRG